MHVSRRTMMAAVGGSIGLAGCLGGGSRDEATVQVRSHPEHGDVLVDGDGLSLYSFDADERGAGESACDSDCADSWPPLTVTEEPTAGDDVAADLSTFERDDGSTQVAANGWPLYYFVSDEEPGDATGHGVNDVWWVLRPDGTPIRPGDEPEEDDDEDGDGATGGY